MPVTRIVPASPITKAPHQLVPLARPFSGRVPSIEAMTPPWFRCQIASGTGRASEERQVTLYLPVADDRVPGAELLPLDLGVIVDVVAVGRLAQRLAQHAVGYQRVRRVQQRRGQRLDAARGDLLGRHYVQ